MSYKNGSLTIPFIGRVNLTLQSLSKDQRGHPDRMLRFDPLKMAAFDPVSHDNRF